MKLNNKYNSQILRYTIAAVFLYFGISQATNPANFIGYLPNFLFESNMAQTIVLVNGIFEIIASILLIIGLKTKIVAWLLAIHLGAITFEMGFTQTGARDFGLTMATIIIALQGPDNWCLDYKMRKKK